MSLCDMLCECSECGDRQVCDIWLHEHALMQEEAQQEEDWKEKRHAEMHGGQ